MTVGYTTTDINSINLDDGNIGTPEQMIGWGDNMQIVGPGGNATEVYLYWDKSMDMSETVKTQFFWGDDACNPVDVTLDPGAGFAIDNPNGTEFTIKIACPYNLNK